jgi:hypothetical protein
MEPSEFDADPMKLRAEAEKEPARRGLDAYSDTIKLLKEEKGFSFREIAAWLQQRGVAIDHNAVWRTYSKTISGPGMVDSFEQNERLERSTAHRAAMPWLDES